MSKKILVVDDDHELGELIQMVLELDGHKIFHAYSGPEGLRATYEIHPDLIVLDIMMPDMDGITLCTRLREMMSTPILMLTALTSEKDIMRGFNAGADDYLKKPFNNDELQARVKALLKRSAPQNIKTKLNITSYVDPILEINLSAQTVKLSGKIVDLSPKEFQLLSFLVQEQGRVVSQRELLREVWGKAYVDEKAIASLYIYYLRKKLKDGTREHAYIRTVWGRGYWFAPFEENK